MTHAGEFIECPRCHNPRVEVIGRGGLLVLDAHDDRLGHDYEDSSHRCPASYMVVELPDSTNGKPRHFIDMTAEMGAVNPRHAAPTSEMSVIPPVPPMPPRSPEPQQTQQTQQTQGASNFGAQPDGDEVPRLTRDDYHREMRTRMEDKKYAKRPWWKRLLGIQ